MSFLPTLRQLQYLVALHQNATFGRAAAASFVTQSTLSTGIRDLETLLGATLVERNRRVVRFTPLGERVVVKARAVLREAGELAELVRAAAQPLGGVLRLGVIPTIAPFLLPRLLPGLRAAYPDLKLFLREEQSGAACAALAGGELDAVLLALPWACGDVATRRLFDDRLSLAFHPADWPDAPATITAGAIDPARLLLLDDGHCLKDHALAACGRPDFRSDAAIRGTSLHTLVQMVANRLGMTLVPQMALDAGILVGTPVVARPVAGDHASREIALAWRASSPRAAEFELLAAALLAVAPCPDA